MEVKMKESIGFIPERLDKMLSIKEILQLIPGAK